MAMPQKAKSYTKEVSIQNLKNHPSKAELDQELVHIFLKMMLKVSWVKQMYKDLMKIWDHKPDQNHKYQDNPYSQNQRVKFYQRFLAKKVKHQVRHQ